MSEWGGRLRAAGATFVLAAIALLAAGCDSSSVTTAPDAAPPIDASMPEMPDASAAVDAPTTPFTEEAMRAASVAYNTKYCAAMQMCDAYNLAFNYGTLSGCIGADVPVEDLAIWFPYGSNATPDALLACANALDLSTCDAYERFANENVFPDACQTALFGTLSEGSVCSYSTIGTDPTTNQCASGRCLGPNGCGQCVSAVVAGGACQASYECGAGLVCNGTTCVVPAEVGESCDSMTICSFNLVCTAGHCATPPEGGSCNPQDGCSVVPGLRYCNPSTLKCESLLVNLGDPCGPIPPATYYFVCVFGSTCVSLPDPVVDAGADSSDAGPPARTYRCVPTIEDGQPCNQVEYTQNACTGGNFRRGICVQNVCVERGPAECTPPPVPP